MFHYFSYISNDKGYISVAVIIIMATYAQVRVNGTQPDFIRILKRLSIDKFKLQRKTKSALLQVYVPDTECLMELIRRLRPKKMRKGTRVTLLEVDTND